MFLSKAYDLKMFPALCVEHSKICRDFSKKLAICIFGCPKLYLGGKKLRKFFFDFHRGDPYVFPQISSKISRWFLKESLKKNHKGPPYEKCKNLKNIFFNFFHPRYSLGHPKMHIGSLFEKSLHTLECSTHKAGNILRS